MALVMISMIQPLHIGNAIRLYLEPPTAAVEWKVLRKGSASFSGHDDPSALLAYQGDENVIVDVEGLQNEQIQFYCAFYTSDRSTWSAGNVVSATPRAIYEDHTTDVLSYLRERLEAGLLVECQRGNFQPEIGYIQVYTAPPSLERDLRFPLVTLHLESEQPGERGLGEVISGDVFDSIGFDWQESEGWLARVQITIVGWSLNSDERIELRKAIRRLIIANMSVFDSLGWVQIDLSQQDVNAINGEYPSPIYQVMSTFSCVAPVRVSGKVDAVSQVQQTIRSQNE